jgi:hypothetical protein
LIGAGNVTEAASQPPVPYETATECKRLINFGHEPKEIAARLGITRRYVDDLLLLVDPVDYLADLAHGAVGPLQLFPTSIVQRLAL